MLHNGSAPSCTKWLSTFLWPDDSEPFCGLMTQHLPAPNDSASFCGLMTQILDCGHAVSCERGSMSQCISASSQMLAWGRGDPLPDSFALEPVLTLKGVPGNWQTGCWSSVLLFFPRLVVNTFLYVADYSGQDGLLGCFPLWTHQRLGGCAELDEAITGEPQDHWPPAHLLSEPTHLLTFWLKAWELPVNICASNILCLQLLFWAVIFPIISPFWD